MHYESVIGLEVHAQLNTKSKLFCRCSTAYGGAPNTQTCVVCQGHPGVLPALNQDALRKTIQTGLACNSEINYYTKFDRKNYFYPDLPKAYQISQYDFPLCKGGQVSIEIDEKPKVIRLNRIHLEEDAGRLIHSEFHESYIDLNRSGVPLIEIVSEPDMRTSQEAYQYLSVLRQILQYIEVSDCNLEKGSLRCDANVSVRLKGQTELGVKTEIKNLNSFRNVQHALEYEILRQIQLIEAGKGVSQETRLYNADLDRTELMRSKEAAHNYRYFPDPDLVPVNLQQGYVEELRNKLPELPRQRETRFMQSYGLTKKYSRALVAQKQIACFYEEALAEYSKNAKRMANWVMVEVMGILNSTNQNISELNLKPKELARLIQYIDEDKISGKIAKDILRHLIEEASTVDKIIQKLGIQLVRDDQSLNSIIDGVLRDNSKVVESYKSGKAKALDALIGSVMRVSKGQADPQRVSELLEKKLC